MPQMPFQSRFAGQAGIGGGIMCPGLPWLDLSSALCFWGLACGCCLAQIAARALPSKAFLPESSVRILFV